MFQVLSRAKYWSRLGEVELRFHEEMRPLLLELKERFTTIPAEYFFRLRSVYAMKFYMVCRSWNPQTNRLPQWSMTVRELRRWLDLAEGEYEQTKHLRDAIIERAKHELDAVADVTFRYEAVLEGKGRHARVVAWNFIAVGNTPKVALPAGARARKTRAALATASKQAAQEAESARRLPELERIWREAVPEDRARWVRQMDLTPPSSGQRPSPLFLFAFEAVLQRDQQAELPFGAQPETATEDQ
jgi:plasmid replication initiation protein